MGILSLHGSFRDLLQFECQIEIWRESCVDDDSALKD